MPTGVSAVGLSIKSTCLPSGEKKGCTQQLPLVNRRREGAGVGEGVGTRVEVGVDVAVGLGVRWEVEVESLEESGGNWGDFEEILVVVGSGVGGELFLVGGLVAAEEALQAVAPNTISNNPVIIRILSGSNFAWSGLRATFGCLPDQNRGSGFINALQRLAARAVRIR